MSNPHTLRRLRITRRAADRIRSGHLWVYRTDLEPDGHKSAQPKSAQPEPAQSKAPNSKATNSEAPNSGELKPGSLVTLIDSRDIPLGTALYSSSSQIAARLISRTPALTRSQYLDDLRLRIDAALELRRQLTPIVPWNHTAGAATNAHRLIFSEADNLPGIIADRYNDLVLIQLLIQGTAQDDVRAVLIAALREAFAAEGHALTIWERTDPRIRELEQLPSPPSAALFTTTVDSIAPDGLSFRTGTERDAAQSAPTTTTFALNGLRFHYDAASGQKTGAFLDQRLNYAAAARIVQASVHADHADHASGLRADASGLRALDICTYQGGFALHLAQVCSRVTGVDTSRAALEAADRNLSINPDLRAEVDWIEADAFDYLRHLDDLARTTTTRTTTKPGAPFMRSSTAHGWGDDLHRNPHLFDAIVLDPPAFAKSKRATEGALRGYKELNLRALRLLAPGGTLITNSCSHHVSLADFTAIVAAAAADAGRRVQLLETHAAAPDHPEVLTLPETCYLKCLICRVD